MADARAPGSEPPAGVSPTEHPSTPGAGASPIPGAPQELFAQLFESDNPPVIGLRSLPVASVIRQPSIVPAHAKVHPAFVSETPAMAPPAPTTLQECGLSLMQVCDLLLKQLYLGGHQLSVEMARQARLPFPVIDEALQFLKDEKCAEVTSSDVVGRVSYRFALTDLGRVRARESFEQCRYVGPAPVPLEHYVKQCLQQTVTGTACNIDALRNGFTNLIIHRNLLEELGPAVCSGRSIFLYGPPGNGKTVVAKGLGRFLNQHGGEIYIPYAILAENSIITMYDPTVHTATDNDDLHGAEMGGGELAQNNTQRIMHATPPDLRWRRIKRPVVITGGELTLDMLDLRYNTTSNFYQAPMHIKANGGVFLIDDFGRQIVSPRDLLNRWIIPLEERVDHLTLATGRTFQVPFEQLTIFSTNLDPRQLVDDAFLRRIRHKILIDSPGREVYTAIFQLACEVRNLEFCQDSLNYLYRAYYDAGHPPRASDPRDLLEIVVSICRFRGLESQLTEALISEAALRFFAKL
ncbi:MAG: ATPase [Planctomycetaceae bacterium]|nr:ATPase [Planctomycetaceae bacterium]